MDRVVKNKPAKLFVTLAASLWCVCAAHAGGVLSGLPDPTRPVEEPAGVATGGGGGPQVQSILLSPTRKLAVIDGQVYRVGAKFDGAVVREIRPDAVVLVDASGRTQRLQLLPRIKNQQSRGAREDERK
jgi:MSHA biogenesis protein MshK